MPPSSRDRQTDRTGVRHEPRNGLAGPVETLLRSLLASRGRREAQLAVIEGVRTLLRAAWVALYREDDGEWICRAATGRGPRVGDRLPADLVPDEPAALVLLPVEEGDGGLGLHLPTGEGGADLLQIGPRLDGTLYGTSALRGVARLAADLSIALRRGDELDRLRAQAFVDPLTQCYNRRGFDEHLHVELRRARRYQRPLALMLVDLDGFKRINDELGHQAGDHVLRRFSSLLSSTFRTTDIVSRYGGDEFAVIFPETTKAEAVNLAERLRALAAGLFPDGTVPRPITASFGVAASPEAGETADELVEATDRALYRAKNEGRDRVVVAADTGTG